MGDPLDESPGRAGGRRKQRFERAPHHTGTDYEFIGLRAESGRLAAVFSHRRAAGER
jgi:hypothetical protein